MAKKPAKPAKSHAKAKTRKAVGAKARKTAKPLRKKTAPKLAHAKKHATRPKAKSARPLAKNKLVANKPAPKGKIAAKVPGRTPAKVAKPLPKIKLLAAAKPANGPSKTAPKAAKQLPVPAGKTAKGAIVTPPAPGHKPTAGEIAAKIAGKRAEDANRKGKNGRHAEIAPRVLTPADVEARKRRLKSLIVLGKDRGFLTFAEINDHLPDDVLDAEQIEGIISMIGDMGIQVYDVAPDAETLLLSDAAPTAPAEDF